MGSCSWFQEHTHTHTLRDIYGRAMWALPSLSNEKSNNAAPVPPLSLPLSLLPCQPCVVVSLRSNPELSPSPSPRPRVPACLRFYHLAGIKSLFATLSLSSCLSLPLRRISICLCGFAFSFGQRFCFLRFTFAFKQGQFRPLPHPPPVGNVNIPGMPLKCVCFHIYLGAKPWPALAHVCVL